MRIGLTGHYASGKTTVSKLFEKLGGITLDTDRIAREIVEPEMKAYRQIVDYFGSEILSGDLTLNRKKLGEIVFSDTKKLEMLNSITHPAILEETLKQSTNLHKLYMINVPLLFQTNFHTFMDKTIIVTANERQLIDRGQKRDKHSEEHIRMRLKNQISINRFLKNADYIIDNSGSIENTEKQVIEIWNSITTTMK